MRTPRLGWVALALFLAACGDDARSGDDGGTVPDGSLGPACESVADCPELACSVASCVDGHCRFEPTCPADRCIDGACVPDSCATTPDADGDGATSVSCGGTDCDDSNPRRYPGAQEVCDAAGVDEDCDPTTHGRRDLDRDGFDDAQCRNTSAGEVMTVGEDCDDTRPSVHPGATEVCNGLDDDCDGAIDEEMSIAGFADLDVDGHGDPSAPMRACPGASHFAVVGDDCDDTTPAVHGAMFELCDEVDNDCDGRIDENVVEVAWYPDTDGDGWGAPGSSVRSCAPIEGASMFPLDCDDADPLRHPGGAERCNGLDDDCNGLADFVLGPNDWEDDDDDGFADAACGAEVAEPDCDDGDYAINPRAAERCGNGLDDDCDGAPDEGCGMPRDAGMPLPDGGGTTWCEADLDSDTNNCGGCGVRCRARPHSDPVCVAGTCGLACAPNRADCNRIETDGCETVVASNPLHCGGCGIQCSDDEACVGHTCVRGRFRSSGEDGAFEPTGDIVLDPGVYDFTTIHVRAGVTVRMRGTGVLDLRATGDVIIEGRIDVSGGAGGVGIGEGGGGNGGGGWTGYSVAAATGTTAMCAPGGGGGFGAPGQAASSTSDCGLGGQAGGGAGGFHGFGGGGGGGAAGGGGGGGLDTPGGAGGALPGNAAGAGGMAATGDGNAAWIGRGAEPTLGEYAGLNGTAGGVSGGGGGGSIGADAAADLAVETTFRPGSGGGGGGWGIYGRVGGSGGGGGGGGALRIASATRIDVREGAEVRADGGAGGQQTMFLAGGGGGSGGVVYLAAPALRIAGVVSAVGGPGGAGFSGALPRGASGGRGGLGRLRISTDPARCEILSSAVRPAMPLSGCEPVGAVPGYAYVARYPN